MQDVHATTDPEVVIVTCNPARGRYRDATGYHAYDNQVVVTKVVGHRPA